MNCLMSRVAFCLMFGALFVGCIDPQILAHSTGIYAAKDQAEKRAKELGCDSVHQNNGRWMPCDNEAELHRMLRKE